MNYDNQIKKKSRGLIALDLDGTVTAHAFDFPKEVAHCLTSYHEQGWHIAFITGRTLSYAQQLLGSSQPFPYFLAVQNGAALFRMPSQDLLETYHLSLAVTEGVIHLCQKNQVEPVLFSGPSTGDLSYYRRETFSPKLMERLTDRREKACERWRDISDFSDIDLSGITSIKCFGSAQQLAPLVKEARANYELHAPVIRDGVLEGIELLQITHPQAQKGDALRLFHTYVGGMTIAAGDDQNDQTMLTAADCAIAMATAPKELLAMADIIAPPAEERGIIQGLKQAVKREKR